MFYVFKHNMLRMFLINLKNFMLELANVSQMLVREWYTYVRGKVSHLFNFFSTKPQRYLIDSNLFDVFL